MSTSDAENSDPGVLIDDGLGNIRRTKQRQKNDLRLNYDSDSADEETENPDGGQETKTEEQTEEKEADDDDDDDDMFASDNEESPKVEKKPKMKSAFLDVDEFQKQEGIGEFDLENKYKTSENSASQDDAQANDADVARYYNEIEEWNGKRYPKKEPKLEAFDLREETAEGNFDLEGNFIRNEQREEPDAEEEMLGEFKKTDIAKAKQAQEKRQLASTQKLLDEVILSIPEILEELILLLAPAETPLEALVRLNPRKSKKKIKVDTSENPKKDIVRITHLCTRLSEERGFTEVYEMEREELMRSYKSNTGEDFNQTKRGTKREYPDSESENEDKEEIDYGEKIWEFRWKGDAEINGPFSSYEMNHWKNTHFEGNVDVRKVGNDVFLDVSTVDFN